MIERPQITYTSKVGFSGHDQHGAPASNVTIVIGTNACTRCGQRAARGINVGVAPPAFYCPACCDVSGRKPEASSWL